MANYVSKQPITANDDYDINGLVPGQSYAFSVTYPSGVTATVTPKELGADGTTYQTMTKDGSDVSVTATGTGREFRYIATSETTRFAVASISGGNIYIRHFKVRHGS